LQRSSSHHIQRCDSKKRSRDTPTFPNVRRAAARASQPKPLSEQQNAQDQ
jgi:hypothetical protein